MRTFIKDRLIRYITVGLLSAGLSVVVGSAKGQLNPFQSVYFQNKYTINPAMAGMNHGLVVNLGYRQQWSLFPGTPKTQTMTAEYQATDRVGLGLNVSNDKAGLLAATRVMATYAYHLPIGDNNKKLNFGLSLGINDPYITTGNVNGDASDIQIADYNQLKAYVDGDFGAAYTSDQLTVEAAVPNLKAVFFQNADQRIDVDRNTFMAAASYKFILANEMTLEPKAMMRGVKGYNDIYDGAVNFVMRSYGISAQAIYHSTQSLGFGLAFDQSLFGVNVGYNVETGTISSYTAGTFEFGLKLRLFNK